MFCVNNKPLMRITAYKLKSIEIAFIIFFIIMTVSSALPTWSAMPCPEFSRLEAGEGAPRWLSRTRPSTIVASVKRSKKTGLKLTMLLPKEENPRWESMTRRAITRDENIRAYSEASMAAPMWFGVMVLAKLTRGVNAWEAPKSTTGGVWVVDVAGDGCWSWGFCRCLGVLVRLKRFCSSLMDDMIHVIKQRIGGVFLMTCESCNAITRIIKNQCTH